MSRLNPWRFLFALLVLPYLVGADSARQNETLISSINEALTAFDGSQLSYSHNAELSAVSIQFRLLRYADIQGQSPHSEQALFYTELFTHMPLVSAAVVFANPQQSIYETTQRKRIIRAPPVSVST